jgi:hypothetical protein
VLDRPLGEIYTGSFDLIPPARDFAPPARDFAPPARDFAPPVRDFAPPRGLRINALHIYSALKAKAKTGRSRGRVPVQRSLALMVYGVLLFGRLSGGYMYATLYVSRRDEQDDKVCRIFT